MGRKPNALILEFFERGAKLADQSNRYAHTCKRCGEVFPKGRPDSLTRHLFEKCPNITDEDRSRALWQPAEAYASSTANASDSELPLVPRREPSGLDALAEVSRQLQANGQHEEALVAQLRQHMDQETKDQANVNVNIPLMHAATAANDLTQQLQPIKSRKRKAEDHAPLDPQLQQSDDYSAFVNTLDDATRQSSQSHESPHSNQSPLPNHQPLPHPYQAPHRQQVHQMPPQPHYPEPPAFIVNSGGFGLLQRANKNKVRGRFSEERRKEVQSVRKRGACIRCRMLKKPCSEGTPCGTCQNIESARLWKNTCIRSRLAEEFTLYSTSLFHARDHHATVTALVGIEPLQLPGRVEATLFPDTHIYATFPAMVTPPTAPDVCFLLNYRRDPDTLAATLERYLHMVIMQCISSEPSAFMRSTLEVATELSVDHNDVLLGKLINLWAATNLLLSKEPIWTVLYEPIQPPVMDAVQIEHPEIDASSSPSKDESASRRELPPDSRDYAVISAQLQHAAERYCQKQAKFVMNELERRLLQRQQSSAFLTFLAAVILLNCVERMTGLFHLHDSARPLSSDDLQSHMTAPHDDNAEHTNVSMPLHANELPADRPADWPLEDSPAHFWPQGESFSALVHLLLRMRGLPPPTVVRPNGTLVVIPSSSNKAYSSDTQGPGANSQLQLAAAWLDRTAVSAFDLMRIKERPLLELGLDDPREWDLRFIAALLLPVTGGG